MENMHSRIVGWHSTCMCDLGCHSDGYDDYKMLAVRTSPNPVHDLFSPYSRLRASKQSIYVSTK